VMWHPRRFRDLMGAIWISEDNTGKEQICISRSFNSLRTQITMSCKKGFEGSSVSLGQSFFCCGKRRTKTSFCGMRNEE
jgi:hypothetical protein